MNRRGLGPAQTTNAPGSSKGLEEVAVAAVAAAASVYWTDCPQQRTRTNGPTTTP